MDARSGMGGEKTAVLGRLCGGFAESDLDLPDDSERSSRQIPPGVPQRPPSEQLRLVLDCPIAPERWPIHVKGFRVELYPNLELRKREVRSADELAFCGPDNELRHELRPPVTPGASQQVLELALGQSIPEDPLLDQGSDDTHTSSTSLRYSAHETCHVLEREGSLPDSRVEDGLDEPGMRRCAEIDDRPHRRCDSHSLMFDDVIPEEVERLVHHEVHRSGSPPAWRHHLDHMRAPIGEPMGKRGCLV